MPSGFDYSRVSGAHKAVATKKERETVSKKLKEVRAISQPS